MPPCYDLHIHSCLSPCADKEMTPNNICGMAHLKGLKIIAVTDHNSARNLRACQEAARRFDLLFVPGMELCTREDVHLLCYFPSVEQAEEMGRRVRKLLPPQKNRPEFFGEQLLMDAQDEVTGQEEALLIAATSLGFSEACALVRAHGGVPVPAHIHRGNGLVQMLGFIPPGDGLTALELKPGEPAPQGYRILHSSDAHRLGDISEALHSLDIPADLPSLLHALGDIQPKTTGYKT